MKRILLVILVLSVASICYAADEEEKITLTTYYPAPYGKFNHGDFNTLTTSGNTFLAVDSGNVGIGTTEPNYILEVNGMVHFGPPKDITIHRNLEIVGQSTSIGLVNPDTDEKMSIVWDSRVSPNRPERLLFFHDTNTQFGGGQPLLNLTLRMV